MARISTLRVITRGRTAFLWVAATPGTTSVAFREIVVFQWHRRSRAALMFTIIARNEGAVEFLLKHPSVEHDMADYDGFHVPMRPGSV